MHYVLVHGAGLGAWCWYKVQTLLEAAGHNVTLLDMAAFGIDLRRLDELRTFIDYTQPLFDYMESIPKNEKVVLIGHSQGGFNLAFAMEKYFRKIYYCVFLTAFMPDTVNHPSYLVDQFLERYGIGFFLDSQMAPFGRPEDNLTSITFGQTYIATRLYPLSPPRDVTLARSLLRPFSLFQQDLANRSPFTNEKYGSVKCAYIVVKEEPIH